jgi:hypothetical protein
VPGLAPLELLAVALAVLHPQHVPRRARQQPVVPWKGSAWRLPAAARGKRLTVTITATYGKVSATFEPYRFRVG